MENNLIKKNSPPLSESQILIFSVDNKKYAIDLSMIIEIVDFIKPNFSTFFLKNTLGNINYNNLNINIVDLRQFLNATLKKYDINSKIIILKTEETIIGLVAEQIIEIKNVILNKNNYNIKFHNTFVKNIVNIDSQFIEIINIEYLEQEILHSTVIEFNEKINKLFSYDETERDILEKRKNLILNRNFSTEIEDFHGYEKYLIFQSAKMNFALPICYIKEIFNAESLKITKIPTAPDYISGIIYYKSNFFSVLDLEKFFQFETKNENKSKIIIINCSEFRLAFLINDVYNFVDISNSNFLNKHSQEINIDSFWTDIIVNEQIYSVLNMKKILKNDKLYINHNL